MKQVVRFEAEDGNLFDTEEACLRHEARDEFERTMYASNYICWRDTSPSEIVDWMLGNRELVLEFLK